jgi:hypothetical protein
LDDKTSDQKTETIRRLIEQLKSEPRNLQLWFEMETLYDDPARRREILKGILLLDPQNNQAQQSLARLDAKVERVDIPGEESQPSSPETGFPRAEPAAPTGHGRSRERHYRKCPFCAEQILEDAVKCRFCGEYLAGRPPTPLPENAPAQAASSWPRTGALIILALCSILTLVALVLILLRM